MATGDHKSQHQETIIMTKAMSPARCGCDATGTSTGDRQAVGVDPEIKRANLARLKRIEGQVRGLHKMVEEDRYCPDIVTQIASVQEALRGVGRQLLRNHLKHCATAAIKKGPADADRTYDELLELITSISR
jgi:DNA-binding FrmR family transcriptional regulator